MPRKAKGIENELKENLKIETSVTRPKTKSKTNSNSDVKKTSTSKKGATKSASTKKSTTSQKSTTSKKSSLESKKADTKAISTRKTTSKAKKEVASSRRAMKSPTNETTSAKKTTTKKADTKKATTKTTTATKKSTVKSKTTKIVKAKKAKTEEILEYYDLPYRYNETTVKILAQTPKKLFIYWDISDDDRKNYVEKFGKEFFNNTVPVLIVHNDSQNYTFEVEINDFANCWYLDINDTKCKYTIELGRRSKFKNYSIPNNYIYVTSSNVIESPNDHILFEKQTKTVYFRNIKTNATHSKDIANISFIRNMGKIYNIYDAYKELYNKMYSDEDIIDINNPSSMNPTSTFK